MIFDNDATKNFYSEIEITSFVKETLEKKYHVKIRNIEFAFGSFFEFEVETTTGNEATIPSFWEPINLGNGVVKFRMNLDAFQENCSKLEERDFLSVFKHTFLKVYGKDVNIIDMVEHPFGGDMDGYGFGDDDEDECVYEGNYEMIVELKPNHKFANDPFLIISWIEGNRFGIYVDQDALSSLQQHLDEQARKK